MVGRTRLAVSVLGLALRGTGVEAISIMGDHNNDTKYVVQVTAFPYFVSLRERGSCAGAVIGARHVVTAAQCLCPPLDGVVKTIFSDGSHAYPIKAYMNPDCEFHCHQPGPGICDVAVLEYGEDFPAAFTPLPIYTWTDELAKELIITGFGKTGDAGGGICSEPDGKMRRAKNVVAAVEANGYVKSGFGANACPANSAPIDSYEACEEAKGNGSQMISDQGGQQWSPKGCSRSSDNWVFNRHATGGKSSSRQVVCKKAATGYMYLHDGPCASGWLGTGTKATIDECEVECRSRSGCGFFAYAAGASTSNCAYYTAASGCPDNLLSPEFNAYRLKGTTGGVIKYVMDGAGTYYYGGYNAGLVEEGMAQDGDRGGPAVIVKDNESYLAGVNIGTAERNSCDYGSVDQYCRLSSHEEFIAQVLDPNDDSIPISNEFQKKEKPGVGDDGHAGADDDDDDGHADDGHAGAGQPCAVAGHACAVAGHAVVSCAMVTLALSLPLA